MTDNPLHERKYQLQLSELDIKILLEALGRKEIVEGESKAVRVLIERIYRAMGVKLDK